MGLFSKHTRQQPGAGAASNGHGMTARGGGHGGGAAAHAWPYSMSTRPSFGQWLKYTWLDILSMVVLGAIGLGVYEAPPAPTRSFAIDYTDRSVVFPQFAYPMREEIVPIWAAAMLAALVPIVVILFMQIRIRSFWDVNNGVLGLLYSLITAAVFQVFVKWLIGGLRPHFLDVCKPDISRASNAAGAKGAGYNGAGYSGIFYTAQVCTGDQREINDSLESMPSGHTTAAFAGFVYLYLYLNAKLKVFANYHPALWKLAALYAPLLGACLIGGALTIDEYHNWYDVAAGAAIGTAFAFSAYRMVYAAVWDWRFNHIPLNRGAPFPYALEAELADAVWTRQVGWGPGGAGGFGMAGGHGPGGPPHHHHPHGTGGFSHPRKPVPSGAGHRGDDMV